MADDAAASAAADAQPVDADTAAPVADIPKMVQQRTIRVLQWNVLADHLATFDPKGFPEVPVLALDRDRRAKLQEQILMELDADIVCLQEVDVQHRFENMLSETHDSLYMQRHDSTLGLFMAWRYSKINLVGYTTSSYSKSGQNMLIATFERNYGNENSRRFVVATTHLKSVGVLPSSVTNHTTNLRQFGEFEARLRNTLSADHLVSGVIVAADLNQRRDPTKLTVRGYENALRSVYDPYQDTTFKRRGSGDKCESEDVLWSSFQHTASAPLTVPEEPLWPSETWPSDHCVLCADFLV